MQYRLFIFLLFFISVSAQAYNFEDGSLELPEGFVHSVTQDIAEDASTTLFVLRHDDGLQALLQITVWDTKQEFSLPSEEERKKGSKQYLLKFLAGVKETKENFQQQEVEFVSISGQTAAKVQWSGVVSDVDVHGVMYCLLYNSKIYSFHAQDVASFNRQYIDQAVAAFENIKLTH